jgi:hypothetical protein
LLVVAVLIKVEDEEYIVEVDSGEIINTSQPKLYSFKSPREKRSLGGKSI